MENAVSSPQRMRSFPQRLRWSPKTDEIIPHNKPLNMRADGESCVATHDGLVTTYGSPKCAASERAKNKSSKETQKPEHTRPQKHALAFRDKSCQTPDSHPAEQESKQSRMRNNEVIRAAASPIRDTICSICIWD